MTYPLLINPFLKVVCKLQSIVNFDCYVIMPPTIEKVGKLKIINKNLNKQFISLRKVIIEHRHKTP